MDKSIKKNGAVCSTNQQVKIHKHTKVCIQQFQLASTRFQNVHLDLVGPLVPANTNDLNLRSYKYILMCIDRTTKWVETQPLLDITAKSVTKWMHELLYWHTFTCYYWPKSTVWKLTISEII